MKLIYGSRQSGRTTELIKLSAQDPFSAIVCPNIEMCNEIYSMSRRLGCDIPMPISINQLLRYYDRYYGRIRTLYFDDFEYCLEVLLGRSSVKAIVINKDVTEIKNTYQEI